MRGFRLRTLVCVSALSLLMGCAAINNDEVRMAQRPRFELPPQASDSIRLIIYRPQVLVGMWGRPVVLINGRKMLGVLSESLLDPGSVFVVDAPAGSTQVTWLQARQTVPSAEPIVFKEQKGATRFLRWTLKPTYGYLELVTEEVARGEIGPLRYMGYRKVEVTE